MTAKYLLFTNIRGVLDEQYAIYEAAKACGYDIIMMAPSIPEHLKAFTAVYQCNDNKNELESIRLAVALAEQYEICGVFSWTDTDVVLSAKIAQAIGIPSLDVEAAYLARNKFEMRKAVFRHNPALVPCFVEVNSFDELQNHIATIGFPAVLKPVSASGSKGIFIINNLTEAQYAFNALNALSNDPQEGWFYNRYGNKFILESFIFGKEFSVEGLVVNNEIVIAGITDKLTTDDWHLEYRHIFPANYSEEIYSSIVDATREVIHALNLNNCPIHLEGKWTKNGFKLIEIAARIGGDLIHTHLIANSLNFNWLCFIIKAITEGELPLLPSLVPHKCSGIQFVLAESQGRFQGINHDSTIPNTPGFIKIHELIERGQMITLPPLDFAMQRVAYVMAEAEDFSSLELSLGTILERVIKKNEFI